MDTQDMEKHRPSEPACERTQAGSTNPLPDFNTDDFTDLVAFVYKCDIIEHGNSTIDKNVSQKKCRFCD